jgi:HD-GYP domain-containing protein (c-di-GMP phosphodiesterase class II)
MLRGFDFLRGALPIVLHHHERWNGSGYPIGLRGREIPLGARIFGVADAYDAMTSHRPYRRALSHEVAVAELRRNAATQFDPDVVDAFLGAVVPARGTARAKAALFAAVP